MDRPQVGDMVVVVRWASCGCGLGRLGKLVRIAGTHSMDGCSECGLNVAPSMQTEAVLDDGWRMPIEWLKRIPPLSELESEKRDEKLTEPA